MKWIKWLLFNILIGFIFVDGTIGVSNYESYSANLIPFVCGLLVLLSVIAALVMVIVGALCDEMDTEAIAKLYGRIYKTTKTKVWLNVIVDTAFILLLAVHGFTISSFIYLLHLLVALIATFFKNEAIDDMQTVLHNTN